MVHYLVKEVHYVYSALRYRKVQIHIMLKVREDSLSLHCQSVYEKSCNVERCLCYVYADTENILTSRRRFKISMYILRKPKKGSMWIFDNGADSYVFRPICGQIQIILMYQLHVIHIDIPVV